MPGGYPALDTTLQDAALHRSIVLCPDVIREPAGSACSASLGGAWCKRYSGEVGVVTAPVRGDACNWQAKDIGTVKSGGLTAKPDHILYSRSREECVQCWDCGVERLRREVDRSVNSSALRDRLGQNVAPSENLRFVHARQRLANSTKGFEEWAA
jgi:hypothetical protein